jgi:hypothetical protein
MRHQTQRGDQVPERFLEQLDTGYIAWPHRN